jgi:putative FmdB family regulatory protein
MPLYAYKCTGCELEFDVYQGFREENVKECPECEGVVQRVFSPSTVIFKGRGFYVTDNVKPAK